MGRELVLLLQEKVGWDNLSKYFGQGLFQLDSSTEQIVVNPEHNDKVGDGRIYIKRHVGIVIGPTSRTRVVYDQGKFIVSGQEVEINELVLTKLSGRRKDTLKLALNLAKKYKCILESRRHEQRAVDMISGSQFGRFHVKEFASRTIEDALQELIWWHLCGISQASAEFITQSQDRLPVRRLRVELRKLRAVLAMLASVLHPNLIKWRSKFREYSACLSRLRELDVALSGWRSTSLNCKTYNKQNDKFAEFLFRERELEEQKVLPEFALTKFTPFLLAFMLWMERDQVKENKEALLLDKIAYKKLGRWHKDMQSLAKENPAFKNDELAHEMRIKAKSMRYVMQSMSGKAYGDETKIMRTLKKLLDALGVLHDNWVNEQLAKSTIKKSCPPEVIYQAGIFTGNERAQALRVQRLLPAVWEKFEADWEKWY